MKGQCTRVVHCPFCCKKNLDEKRDFSSDDRMKRFDIMHKKIHFIGLNEAIMADLAMILHRQGVCITSNSTAPLLYSQPDAFSQEHIHRDLECVIVGREIDQHHVELKAAQASGLSIYDYPTYIYQHLIKDKQRMVVVGDQQATDLIFSMVRHVMQVCKRPLDYIATMAGLDVAVQLSHAPLVLIQADTAPVATFENTLSALAYHPHIALIHGIGPEDSSDEVRKKEYISGINRIADALPKAGSLVYHAEIKTIQQVGEKERVDVKSIPYRTHEAKQQEGKNYLITPEGSRVAVPYALDKITLQAIAATYGLLKEVAVTSSQFYQAMTSACPAPIQFLNRKRRTCTIGQSILLNKVAEDDCPLTRYVGNFVS
eukprot:gene340-432_t